MSARAANSNCQYVHVVCSSSDRLVVG